MKFCSLITTLFFSIINLSLCTTVEDEISYIQNLFKSINLQRLDTPAEYNINSMLFENKYDLQFMEDNDLKLQYTIFKDFYTLSLDSTVDLLKNFKDAEHKIYKEVFYEEFVREVVLAAMKHTITKSCIQFKTGLFTKSITELAIPCFKKIYNAFCILQNNEYEKLLTESENLFNANINHQNLKDGNLLELIMHFHLFNDIIKEKISCFSKPYSIDDDGNDFYALLKCLDKKLSKFLLFKFDTFISFYKKRTDNNFILDQWLRSSDTQLLYANYFKKINYIFTFFLKIIRMQLSQINNDEYLKDYEGE